MDAFFRLLMGSLPPPSDLDQLRLHGLIHDELHRIRGMLLPRLPAPENKDDPFQPLLRHLHHLLLQHPIAAQAAFSSLVAEGRRFAVTPEGQRWATSLASSEMLQRLSELWTVLGLDMLEEDPHAVLPSTYLEALLRGAESPNASFAHARSQPARGAHDGEP